MLELPHPFLEIARSVSGGLRMNLIRRNSRLWIGVFVLLAASLALLSSCAKTGGPGPADTAKGTPAEADKFIEEAEKRLLAFSVKSAQAEWVKSTFITKE